MGDIDATHAILDYEKSSKLPHIPIVVLTTNNLKGDRERLLEEGMDEFLPKPIELEAMKSILKNYFPDNISHESKQADIILYRERGLDSKMFDAILQSMGYTVDTVSDMDSYREKIESVDYSYSFIDASLLARHQEIPELLRKKQIKNIVFVDKPVSGKTDINLDYCDLIIPNIADKKILEFYINKI